jgi:hypothetical protein
MDYVYANCQEMVVWAIVECQPSKTIPYHSSICPPPKRRPVRHDGKTMLDPTPPVTHMECGWARHSH